MVPSPLNRGPAGAQLTVTPRDLALRPVTSDSRNQLFSCGSRVKRRHYEPVNQILSPRLLIARRRVGSPTPCAARGTPHAPPRFALPRGEQRDQSRDGNERDAEHLGPPFNRPAEQQLEALTHVQSRWCLAAIVQDHPRVMTLPRDHDAQANHQLIATISDAPLRARGRAALCNAAMSWTRWRADVALHSPSHPLRMLTAPRSTRRNAAVSETHPRVAERRAPYRARRRAGQCHSLPAPAAPSPHPARTRVGAGT